MGPNIGFHSLKTKTTAQRMLAEILKQVSHVKSGLAHSAEVFTFEQFAGGVIDQLAKSLDFKAVQTLSSTHGQVQIGNRSKQDCLFIVNPSSLAAFLFTATFSARRSFPCTTLRYFARFCDFFRKQQAGDLQNEPA